jgi:hypothetical protein
MNWKKVGNLACFVLIVVLAINLIEYHADYWLAEMAGDLFGALALMSLVNWYKELEDQESY